MTPRLACALALGALASSRLAAQDPVKLPAVRVRATPDMPGPSIVAGVVSDTADARLSGVELSIAQLHKRASSGDDGTFRFPDVGPGTYSVRARRLGFAPQVHEVTVGKEGGVVTFELVPLARTLVTTVVTAARGGLSGIVADTAYAGIPGVTVHVLGSSPLHTETDSTGRFFVPARAGNYMVQFGKTSYEPRILGITIPADSGKQVTIQLGPSKGPIPVRSASNIADLQQRLTWRLKAKTSFYTRDDLERLGIEWVNEAVRIGGVAQYEDDCNATVNGGPDAIDISTLTVEDIESLEIYNSARAGPSSRAVSRPKRGVPPPSRSNATRGVTNTGTAAFLNWGKFCPTIYVWMRSKH